MAKLNFSIALGLAAQNFKQGLNGVQNQLKGFASSVKSVFGMVAGAFAAGQIKAFSQECMNAYSAQLQAEQKLSVIMKQRMGVTDAEVKSVLKLASAQQQLGVIGDEVQLAGAQQVATFLNEKKSLDTLVPAMNNLLAQQKGLNASQGDAVSIGNLMGKVMQGQTSALKRVGITFTEAEEKVLKYGNEQERAAMLAKVITNNVGDMNSELAKTDAGKMQQLSNTLGDLKEKIGAALMPIMGQLAPMISNFATNGANAIVGFINTVQQNIQALVGFIVMQFAGIGLVKIFSQWLASYKTHSAQLEATAAASTTKRLAYEQRLNSQKIALLKLEAAHDEATGKKKEAIAIQVTAKKKELAATEEALNAAKNAEIVAQEEAAAFKTASVWKKGMLMAKMSFIGFMTTVKTLFRSFAPLLIFELLFTVGMKVYDMLSKNSKGFMALAKVVGGAVMQAISLLADGLAAIFDYVADLFGLVDKKGKKYRSKKTGKVYNSMEELNAAEGKGSKAKPSPGSGGGGGGATTAKTKQESDYQQWLKQYTNDVAKADASLKLNNITEEEYEKKRLSQIKSAQEDLALMKAANPAEAKLIEAKKKSLAAEREYYTQLTNGVTITAKKFDSAAYGKVGTATYDSTFDYKKSADEITTDKLELELSNAKAKLEELKRQAEEGCVEALNKIDAASKKVTSLEDGLKLHQVETDVKNLQKQLDEAFNFDTIQQSWGAIEGTVSSISSLVDTLESPDASGWEKFAAVINTVMGLVSTFNSIYTMFNTIHQISTALSGAKAAATAAEGTAATSAAAALAAETPVLTANAAATKTAAAAAEQLAAAEIFAAHASIPFAGPGIAAGLVEMMEGVMTGVKLASAYSTGGIVKGASPVGDFVPAYLNSQEAVLNPTQQSRFMRIANGGGVYGNRAPLKLNLRVRGRDLVTCEGNEKQTARISGRNINL